MAGWLDLHCGPILGGVCQCLTRTIGWNHLKQSSYIVLIIQVLRCSNCSACGVNLTILLIISSANTSSMGRSRTPCKNEARPAQSRLHWKQRDSTVFACLCQFHQKLWISIWRANGFTAAQAWSQNGSCLSTVCQRLPHPLCFVHTKITENGPKFAPLCQISLGTNVN